MLSWGFLSFNTPIASNLVIETCLRDIVWVLSGSPTWFGDVTVDWVLWALTTYSINLTRWRRRLNVYWFELFWWCWCYGRCLWSSPDCNVVKCIIIYFTILLHVHIILILPTVILILVIRWRNLHWCSSIIIISLITLCSLLPICWNRVQIWHTCLIPNILPINVCIISLLCLWSGTWIVYILKID